MSTQPDTSNPQPAHPQAPPQQAPYQQAPPPQGPYPQAPYQQGPYPQGQYQQAPYQQGQYQQAPYQQAPYQQAPYQQAPYQQAPRSSGSRPWIVVAGLAVVVAVIALGAALFLTHSSSTHPTPASTSTSGPVKPTHPPISPPPLKPTNGTGN
jgi:hypothetical protein